MIIRNWEKHKVLLPILITVLVLLTLTPSYGSDDNPVKEKPDRQKILILHYSKNKEKITVCQQEENRITEADYGYIGNVREADRYLRYFYNDKVNVLHIESGRLNEMSYLRFGSKQRSFLIGFEAFMTGKNLKNNQIFQENIVNINSLDMSDFSFMNDSSYMKSKELCNFFTTGSDSSYLLTSPYIGGEDNLICRVSFNRNKKYLPDVSLDFFGNSEKLAEGLLSPETTDKQNQRRKYETKDPINPAESRSADNLAFLNYKQNCFSLYKVSERRLLTQDDITDWNKLISNLKYYKKSRIHSLIAGKLSFDAKRTINNIINVGDIDAQTKIKIIRGLNEFITRKSDDFPVIFYFRLSSLEFLPLGNFNTVTYNPITLNRILIDTAFQDSVAKSSLPELLVSFKPIYRDSESKRIPIPHKCWSPAGDKILFTGALEKEYCANVYTIDINSRKIEKVLDIDDSSRNFNPDLEWNENGMAITCKDGIFVRDVKAMESSAGKLVKLPIPQNISDLKNGRISPDGKQLFFFGKKDGNVNLFVYNFADSSMINEIIGNDPDMENYQGTWIYKDRMSIIKNEMDYLKNH